MGPLTLIYFDHLQVLTVNFKNRRKKQQRFFDNEQKAVSEPSQALGHMNVHIWIPLTISITKGVNTCWIPSPVVERIHAKKNEVVPRIL